VRVELAARGWLGIYRGEMQPEAVGAIRRELLRRKLSYVLPDRVVIIGSVVFWSCFTIFAAWTLYRAWNGYLALLMAACVALNLTIAAFYTRWMPRASPEELASLCLDQGCCASCGYDLLSVEPDGEGLRRCPECGAVWMLDASKRPPLGPGIWYDAGRMVGALRWKKRVSLRERFAVLHRRGGGGGREGEEGTGVRGEATARRWGSELKGGPDVAIPSIAR
jgi:hypothetical protein